MAEEHKPFGDILWCCHVRGPDDIYAAPDYETAVKWADITNSYNWRGRAGKNEPPESYADCLLKAMPAIYPGTAEEHAAAVLKSIHDFTPRNQLPPDDPDYRAPVATS
jgi:hypothetical protein